MSKSDRVGEHWSNVTKARANRKSPNSIKRWQQSEPIVSLINERVCGRRIPGRSMGLNHLLKQSLAERGEKIDHAVSIAGGGGSKEMNLLKLGLVNRFTIYELSEERIRIGRESASRRGFDSRIRFVHGDAFREETTAASYDMVHWNDALHHMDDVFAAVKWSKMVLRPGGYFYLDDFVGASRFQWSELELQIVNRIRRRFLGTDYLKNPDRPGEAFSVRVRRPDRDRLISIDPSEAADSERILDAIQEMFADAQLIKTGGLIYRLALRNLIQNFEDEESQMLLELLMETDFALADAGLTHCCIALARK